VQFFRSQRHGALQSFQERKILGHVVVLSANPLPNSDGILLGASQHYPNT
jgi:hypothetical protein